MILFSRSSNHPSSIYVLRFSTATVFKACHRQRHYLATSCYIAAMVTSLIADWRLWSLNDKHDEYELQSPKISSWNEWKDFNLDTIMNEYRDLLLFIRILYDPMPTPPRPIRNEELFKTSSSASWTDEFDVLSACASWLWSNKTCWETVPSSCSMKELAPRSSTSSIQTLRILSLISPKLPGRTVPGELKPSWKWSLELQHGNIKQRTEFLKVLAQMNHYMVDSPWLPAY